MHIQHDTTQSCIGGLFIKIIHLEVAKKVDLPTLLMLSLLAPIGKEYLMTTPIYNQVESCNH